MALSKLTLLALTAAGFVAPSSSGARAEERQTVRFGITADCHLLGRRTPASEARLRRFVAAMAQWKPDFVIDLGDFACQAGQGQTTPKLHDAQLEGLTHHWALFCQAPGRHYIVMGNHDVGWIKGGDEAIRPADLCAAPHAGEDVTKAEWLGVTGMPRRYYSFDVKGCHFIVLDGNNPRHAAAPSPGRDGVVGAYFIDARQREWLASDLAANRDKAKLVFCHEELHHTPPEGSREGGDVPFPPVGKEGSYVDNGWQLRAMFQADGRVLACFFGHKHRNRWTVYGGVHYITLAATHWDGSFAKVALSDKLHIQGHAKQRSYALPVGKRGK